MLAAMNRPLIDRAPELLATVAAELDRTDRALAGRLKAR
jgi:hypothetical protein